MAKDLDLSEFGGTPELDLSEFDQPAPQPASTARRAADTGLALGKGIVAVPETAVGLSNIVTGGRTGKAVERLGVRFKDAKQVLTDFQSDEQKAADAQVQQADGFLPTVGAMVENPSTIANALAESVPSMLAGGAVSRGLVNKGVGAITAGAVGEGVVSAGSAAEQVRQEGATGFLTPKQAALAATSGAATGVINRASGKLADKLGIADVNTTMATGKLGGGTDRGILRRTAYGAVNEGVLQELPQSMQEQALQNLALDKPVGEGVAEAGAAGMLVGNLTGGAFGAVSRSPQTPSIETDSPDVGAVNPPPTAPGVSPSVQGGGIAPPQEPPKPPPAPPPPPPSKAQAMGINPAAGPLQAAAGVTVDTGADVITQDQEAQKQKAEAAAKEKAKPGADGKKPEPEAPPPVQPVTPDPTAPITGPFTQAIHGASNVTPPPAPAVDPQGPAATQGAGTAVDAPAAPGVGADQGPQGAGPVPVAVPEPAPAKPSEQPDNGALKTGVEGVSAPAGNYKPGDKLTTNGRTFLVTGVAHTGKTITVKATDGKGFAAGEIPVSQPTQESTNATQQSRPGETIDPETGEITQSGPQGAGGDGGQRPADALQPGADAKGPQPAPGQPTAPAPASTPPEGKPASTAESVAARERKDRWLKNVADAHRLAGSTGVEIGGVVNGRVNFLGNPNATKQGRALQGSVEEAINAGATPQEIVDAAKKPAAPAQPKPPAPTTPVDMGAHTAATSPHNDRPEPTQAQKEAGNAKLGHIVMSGLGLSIENPEGSTRRSKPDSPVKWETTMKDGHYGYVKGSIGMDGDHVDTFIKPGTPLDHAGTVFVIDQIDPATGKPDEHKVMIGYPNGMAARQAYQGNYQKGWKGFKAITPMAWDEFKAWVKSEETKKPAAAASPSPSAAQQPAPLPGPAPSAAQSPAPSAGTSQVPAPPSPVETPPVQPPAPAAETVGPVAAAPKTPEAAPAATPPAPSGQEDQGEGQIASSQASPDGTPDPAAGKAPYNDPPPAPKKPEIVVDKAEIRPYRKPDGSIGYEAVPIQPPTPVVEPEPKAKPVASANTIFTEDAAAAARARLKAKLGRLNSGLDPETMLDGITLAGYHIEKGARTFAAYAKAMLEDLGDGVKPYLKSWYMGVKYDPRAGAFDGMDGAAYVENFKEEKLGQDVSVGDWWYAIDNRTRSNVLAKLGIGNQAPDTPWGQLRRENQPKIEAYYAGLDTAAIEKTAEKADTAPNGSRDDATDSQPGVGQRDPGAVQGADGGRGTPAQQPAAPVDSGNLEAPQPTDAPEPAGPPAADAPGVRAPVADVGPGAGTAGRGNAGNGRTRAGGKGNSAAGARGRGAAGPAPAVKAPESVSPANPGPGDFSIDDPLKIIGGGQVARFEKNKAAIEMRNRLQDEGRMPTREEQTVLAGYTGWGSFGQELFQGSWAKPAPKSGWEARDKWLRENLGQKEWEGMQTSIINAHYTDPPTVLAMWDMVRRMGFTGGRTLEPSIGIGNFYGMMPADMVGRSQRAGIELDPLTGSMAQMLYPNANIQIKGYEASTTPDNFYDLVIGNWPFFEYGPADRRYNRLNPTLHDYFFLKAIDQTRPGGLVVGITSKGTMDKKGISARMEMARKAELVAAFRLPSGAFEEYAGTKVVTDIIILRKRKAPLGIVAGEGWIETKDHPTREGTPVAINEYFHKNPSHVIGEIDYGHGTTTFRPGLIVHRPADMMEQLRRIAEMVPEGAFLADQTAKHISYVANHTKDRTNSLVDTPQGLFVVHGEHMAPAGEILKYELKDPKATQKRVDELKALVKMRQLYGELIDAERSAKGADTQRTALRQAYEAFTKVSGPMSKSFGLQYLRKLDDPFYPSLAALEIGIPDANGKVSYRPATILSESTMRGARAIKNPSVTDAFVLARNESVNPPITRIAEISGKPEAEVRKVLVESGAGYEMPNGDFAPADVYLSGNVRAKLREAKAAVEAGNKAVERNVQALQTVVPADIPYYKIETQMGATWVPPSAYADFVGHMLGIREGIEVGFQSGAWKVDFPSAYNHRAEANSGFGSVHVKFKRLVRAAIANQTITVKGKDEDGREFVMDEETKEVNAKIADMRLKFGEWLWSDPVRRTALEAEYNEVRNAYADPKFDGSFLGFQGMALTLGRGPFNLREHQVNAIWRGLVTRKSLNAHEVGTGKTFTMGGIAVESRRYGIAKKPMLFAHNANSKSVAHEIQMMYPAAKVLYVDNLSKENLKTRMMQIANDDWDVIVMPHSIIDRIGFKEETLMAMAQEELNDLQTSAEEAAAEDNVTITDEMWEDEEELNKLRSVTAKQLVKQRLKILSTIHKLAQQASKEDSVAFEDMGVDMLLVDEAHEFKKPPIATKMKLKGLQTQTSNRSIALMFLTKYVRANNNGANVHLFTGTPITNTMTEVFHMMRYMMQEEMKEVALADWDGWFGSFAREVNDVELTSTGEYEAVTRLQSFINVPELRRMIGQYMDVVFSDDMPEMVPRSVNGKLFSDPTLTEAERAQLLNGRTEGAADRPYKKVVNESSDMSPDQLREFARVQRYANTWKNMSKKDRKTTMTMGAPESPIIHDGIANKASFDVRLVEAIANAGKEGSAEMDPHPDSKAARTIKNLLEIYRGHPQANQVVFMSQGMAKFVTRREGPVGMKRDVTYPAFSTMHDMIERLVAAGVPRDQIAAVDGATSKDRRKEIADAMNTGQIRIVFGSTGSLGVGVNMQRNLRAMHHMDAPWMPGDLEQRNGRGHRQGNQWNTVLEFRYITDRLDGKRWQTLARKQKFITDFMKSKGDVRVIEGDVASEEEGDILSTFAEAAGDPRILLREKLKKTLEGLQSRERMHGIAQSDAAGTIKAEQRDIESMGRALVEAGPVVQSLSELIEQQRGDGFTMTVKGKQYTKRADAVEALDKVAADMRTGDEVAVIGAYGPLQLYAQWYRFADAPFMGVSIPGSKQLDVNANGMSLASLESGLRHRRDNEIPQLEAQIVRAKERMEHARKVLSEPFHMAEKLAKTRRQLEDMERDIEANPVAPPYWLRNGAPIDTEVYRDGKPFTVTGHRWSDRGWFVVGSDERGEVNIPYMQAKDAQGMPLYEEHEFSAPTLTNQPGWYLVTNDKGVTEPAPRKLSAENIKDLLSHNYTIVRAAPPTDAPTEAAPEIVEAATPAKAEPVADEYQRLRVGARHLGQMGFNSPDTRFARSNRTGGVHMDDAEAIIAQIREALPTAPPIIPLESIAQAPADLRKFIRDAGAQDDFEAAYHNGKIYVLPSNVGSATRLQFLLAHHEIRHHGLASMLGPRKNQVLFSIHATNANVRAAAAEQIRRGYATSKVLATEEALADMAVEDLVKLNGWDKIVAAVRQWLRGAVMRLRRAGLGRVADAIAPSEWTDKDVAYLIARAEGVSRGGSAKYTSEGTVFGQDGDMPAFYSALTREINANTARAQPAMGWASTIQGLVKAGKIKREELEWSGVLDWLRLQEGKVTREQLVQFLDANGVRVEETVLGGGNKPPGYDADLELLSDNGLTLERNPEDPSMVAFMDENGDLLSADELAEEPGLAKDLVLAAYRVQEAADADKVPTRYANYQLPGGTNYREVLLTLPAKEGRAWVDSGGNLRGWVQDEPTAEVRSAMEASGLTLKSMPLTDAAGTFKSSHWDQPNVLAHIRVNDRVDVDGKRVLFVEEIQSDWGQEGKKAGFGQTLNPAEVDWFNKTRAAISEGNASEEDKQKWMELNLRSAPGKVPSAPFVTKTDAWLSLALKRIVKMAVDEGYDRVAFISGEQSKNRYKLSLKVSEISWRVRKSAKSATVSLKNGDDLTFHLDDAGIVQRVDGTGESTFDGKSLDQVVGKDVAAKIMAEESGVLAGDGMDIGGRGMVVFYDKLVPNTLKDVLRKVGGGQLERTFNTGAKAAAEIGDFLASVGRAPEPSAAVGINLAFDITPAMRSKVAGGLPLFARGAQQPMPGKFQNLKWQSSTDDMLTAEVGNGWTAAIYMDADGSAELTVMDPRGVDFGQAVSYDSVNEARIAAPAVLAARITENGMQPGDPFDPTNSDTRFARGGLSGVTDKINTTTKTAGNTAAHYRGLGLQVLGRRQITELYGDILPQLGSYSTLMAQMDADKNEAGAEADQIAQDWGKLKDERQLAELMHDATLAQMDPEKPLMRGDDPLTYEPLRERYAALSPEAKKVYVDARDAYRTHHENVRKAIRDRIERSELRGQRKAELLKQMDDEFYQSIKGVYFPLARFGDYVVIVRDMTGKAVSVNRAETINEAEALQAELRKAYPEMTVGKVLKSKEFNAGRDAVGRGFMQNLYEALGKADMDDKQRGDLEDMLGQLYLSALPDLSWAKHGIHRKGTPGFSQDARRAFAQNTFHGARYLAKVRYSDLLENELSDAQKQIDGMNESESFDSVKAQQVIDEMVKRHDAAMNPDGNALSTALTSIGFVFHLGLSPASAVVNLTQTALVAYPIMGAKWGFDKAAAALLKASQQAAANRNDISAALSAEEKLAYNEAVRSGVIDVTMAHDLAGISQGEDAKVSWKLRPVMRWASFLFHHAEKFNRQATFVAAYRLARDADTPMAQAYEQAVKATYDGHFDYSNTNRPRIMQGNAAKVILLFKQYGQNMVYTLARQAYLSMKGKNQFERAQARKALGGLLTMHAAAAGVLGLPMVSTLLAAASMLGGDDDEPWDAEVALRNMLAEALGDQAADVLARGLSRLTPWDISGRVGLDKLILPDIQEGLEGQRLGESAMAAALGPVAGIGVALLKGMQEISDGNFARGLEAMAPSLLRGPARAVRYASEGAIDKTGKPIVEDVGAFGIAGQALGFSPSEVRLATEAKSAVHQADAKLAKRRATLMRHYAMAVIAGDEDGAADAREDILAFNEKNPGRRINPLQMARSVATRKKQIAESQGGVYLPKTRRDAMQAGQFGMP